MYGNYYLDLLFIEYTRLVSMNEIKSINVDYKLVFTLVTF